ncbi:MAG: GNAT family N-acetyltransferase [Candidatus Kapabacteria bacterium]|nr:GNAT family N-acetyltransferase [Candidatus Kapabacteria bacterium]
MSKIENLIVRFGRLDDAKTLAEFNKAMAFESEGIDLDFQNVLSGIKNLMLQTELGFYLIAEIDNKPVGTLMITYEWTDWRDGLFWWIQSVYVIPEMRKRGIYKALYEFVKTLAKSDSRVRGFRLYVDKDNQNAIEVYKKLGMTESNYILFEEKN